MVNKPASRRTESKTGKGKKHLYLFILVLLPLSLHWKNINHEFTTLDDTDIIKTNYTLLSDFTQILTVFQKDNFISKNGNNFYRPIQTVSFMADAYLGGDKPQIYYLSNLFYHIMTVILLFFLFQKVEIGENISFLFACVFAVHPLLTDAIAWIPGRGDILAGLFGAASFYTFIEFNLSKKKRYFVIHSIVFFAALFSKEIVVMLPIILSFYYWFVLKKKDSLKELIPFIAYWAIIICTFFILRHTFLNTKNYISFSSFLSNLQVIPIFFAKLVIPLGLSPMPVYDFVFTAAGIMIIILFSFFLLRAKHNDKFLVLLGIIWFLCLTIPAMFVRLPFAKFRFDYLECRAYLPSIGMLIAGGVIVQSFIRGKGYKVPIRVIVPIILFFSIITYNYSNLFATPYKLFSSVIESNSNNAFALNERGCIHLYSNNIQAALADFDNSIKICPAYSVPYFNKGALYNHINDHIMAEHFYSLALKYDTLYHEENNQDESSYICLSTEKMILNKYGETIELLKNGLRKFPLSNDLHNTLGMVYYSKGKFDSALYEYNKAIEGEKENPEFFNKKGMAEYHLGDNTSALSDFNRALAIKPDFMDAYGNRGLVRLELKDYKGAVSDLTSAIQLSPATGSLYYYRGEAYIELGRSPEARADWEKAIQLGYEKAVDKLAHLNVN
jgi:protein O-mannosyl-transferase